MEIQLNGLVVKPDEVLVVVLPNGSIKAAEETKKALEDIGLAGRAVVLCGPAQLATAPRE